VLMLPKKLTNAYLKSSGKRKADNSESAPVPEKRKKRLATKQVLPKKGKVTARTLRTVRKSRRVEALDEDEAENETRKTGADESRGSTEKAHQNVP